jgi:hypothetical protein
MDLPIYDDKEATVAILAASLPVLRIDRLGALTEII